MDYREVEPPTDLRVFVKRAWSLAVSKDGPAWASHVAMPDGCMEIIRRLSGRSRWNGEQPECFVAGVSTTPAELELGAGSAFIGVRIWPWTWRALTGSSPSDLTDRWEALGEVAPGFAATDSPEAAFTLFRQIEPTPVMLAIGKAIRVSRTPGELSRRAGLSPRALQRWFKRNVGQAPSTYLRLVRFSEAFATLGSSSSGLAGHAVDHGFADQAHMAREFRSLAREPASRARERAAGPFLRED